MLSATVRSISVIFYSKGRDELLYSRLGPLQGWTGLSRRRTYAAHGGGKVFLLSHRFFVCFAFVCDPRFRTERKLKILNVFFHCFFT